MGQGDHALSIFEERLSILGKEDSSPHPVEECDAEVILKSAYLCGDSWLAKVKVSGCTREASYSCNLVKGNQLTPLEFGDGSIHNHN
jgi:hypothetical protein